MWTRAPLDAPCPPGTGPGCPLRRQNKEGSPLSGKLLPHRLLLPNDALRASMAEVAELLRAVLDLE